MEMIEKETVKEVPSEYYHDRYGHDRYASKGVAGTGLGLGIAGTALGLLALGRGNGLNLFGNSGMPENVNINNLGSGGSSPTSFQTWSKECDDMLALTNEMWGLKMGTLNEARNAREVDVNEKFQLWKSQVDADFGLYKSTRDGLDSVGQRLNDSAFSLYKSQRDSYDRLSQRISALETREAVNAAVEPWRAKVLDMRINGVQAGAESDIALEAERRCCSDNKIVNYMNSTFVPQTIAEPTVGTTTHQETIYNPLCGCRGQYNRM